MQRGVIKLSNSELRELYNLVNSSECFLDNTNTHESVNEKTAFLIKISPVKENENKDQVYDIFINENEAEAMLDLMPIPDKDDSQNLLSARIKIQEFLDKKSTSL